MVTAVWPVYCVLTEGLSIERRKIDLLFFSHSALVNLLLAELGYECAHGVGDALSFWIC